LGLEQGFDSTCDAGPRLCSVQTRDKGLQTLGIELMPDFDHDARIERALLGIARFAGKDVIAFALGSGLSFSLMPQ
jgi:hypothetical protein